MKQLMKYAAAATLAAGMVFAQAPAGNAQTEAPKPQPRRHGFMRRPLERIAKALDLTDSQKQQARTIFQQARESSRPIRQELKQNRGALTAAAKNNKGEAEIQKLSTEQGRLIGHLVEIRTEASAKFYQMLTPEQRVKADQMHTQFRDRQHSAERKNG